MPLPYKIHPSRRNRHTSPGPSRPVSKVALFNVLEALATSGDIDANVLTDVAGYCRPTVFYATAELIKYGWVNRVRQRSYMATESGKIALAIHRGREAAWAARCRVFDAKALADWQRRRLIIAAHGSAP